VRLRDDVYARLKARAKQYGAFSMSEAVAKLLDTAESAEKQGLVALGDHTLEWLNGVREALEEEFKTTVSLTPNDVLEIIAYALAANKGIKQQVNALIIRAIKDAVRRHA